MFEAYVTNLGLYPERGAGAGEYLKFPTTVEEVQALFSRIGIDGKQYEEYFITDYDSDILGLTDHLGEYESLDELNYLAHLLEEMTPERAGTLRDTPRPASPRRHRALPLHMGYDTQDRNGNKRFYCPYQL